MKSSNPEFLKTLLATSDALEGSHKFLAKDLLSLADKMSSSRNILFSNNMEQFLVLENPEIPRIFTNFEREVGKYSSSYWQSDREWVVVDKISKFPDIDPNLNYVLILRDNEGYHEIIERKMNESLTENYTYLYHNEVFDTKQPGDSIDPGEILRRSYSFDEDMNYRFGINAKAVYMILNDTIEDAIICSESLANRMVHYYAFNVDVNINENDILLNLYGDLHEYKSFPDVGDPLNGRLLCARRRIEYEKALFDLQDQRLMEINYNTDTPFYCNSNANRLIDIDIYSNRPIELLEQYPYNRQIVRYLRYSIEYHQRIYDVLKQIIENHPDSYSDDISHVYRRCADILQTNRKWRSDNNEFNNLVIVFKVIGRAPLHVGSKLANRFGGKGIVSKILPDDEMPVTEDGERVDIVLNALGVVGRLNPGQLFEVELNFISNEIVRRMKQMDSLDDQYDYLLDYLERINPVQAREFRAYLGTLSSFERRVVMSDVFDEGIYLHQPPFWGNVKFDDICELYKYYDWIKPKVCYWRGKRIETPLVVGEEYMLKLKHEPLSKFSARSTSHVNLRGLPSKSLKYKRNQILYSKTPIRFGEMEIGNLFLSNEPELLMRLLSSYSFSQESRFELVNYLLTHEIFESQEIPISNIYDNHNRRVLDVFFKSLGIRMVD